MKKAIGNKEDVAEFCWAALNDQCAKMPVILLSDATEAAVKAGHDMASRESMFYVVEYCWKNGFVMAMAMLEAGGIKREGVMEGGLN